MKIQIEVEADYLVEEIVKQLKQSGRIVEVVRCKDCKHNVANECRHPRAMVFMEDSDYCSRGERRK